MSEDLSHSDTRLSVQLNGLEVHTYNRSGLYSQLEEKFGLEPGIIPPAVKLSLKFSARELKYFLRRSRTARGQAGRRPW